MHRDVYHGTLKGVLRRAKQVGITVSPATQKKVKAAEKSAKANKKRRKSAARVAGHRNKPQN